MASPSSPPPSVLRWILWGQAAVGCALGVGLAGGFWLRAQGLTVVDFANEMHRDAPRFEWRSIDKRHWQAIAPGTGGGEQLDAIARARALLACTLTAGARTRDGAAAPLFLASLAALVRRRRRAGRGRA